MKLQRDPTNSFQTKNNILVKKLKDGEHITAQEARQLTTYKAIAPRFYGLPKVHKENIPLRPIVSTINSPTSNLSKWLAEILKVAFSDYNSYAVQDSFKFSELINNFQLPEGFTVISLDVVSLFTNVSLKLISDIIKEQWPRISTHTSVPYSLFSEIVDFIYNTNYFVFDNEYYSMIFGLPMGSSLSPILANIAVTTTIMRSLPRLSYITPFFFQYVDDLVTAVPQGGVQEILQCFNAFDQHIQFTVEVENERSVPFLDTKIIRTDDNKLILDWYQKKMSSGRYVHYKSHHNISMKTNVILALKNRIRNIAHPSLQETSLHRLKSILTNNGYPSKFLNRLIWGSTTNRPIQQPLDLENAASASALIYVSIPNIHELTANLCKILKTSENIKIAKYNLVTNRSNFSKLKDVVPVQLRSDVVYCIDCECQRKYIGQCSTTIKQRIALHKSDSNLRPGRCTLASHVNETGHTPRYEEVKVLTQERHLNKRLFLEMCFINEQTDSINSRKDLDNLSSIYSYLLDSDRPSNSNREAQGPALHNSSHRDEG